MRTEIRKARSLAVQLLGELETECRHGDALETLAGLMGDPEADAGKLETAIQEGYRQAISLPARIDGLHKLAETLKALDALERRR